VCIECAVHHATGKYDVVNSGCAKGKFLLADRELAWSVVENWWNAAATFTPASYLTHECLSLSLSIVSLPSVVEYDHTDDHKTIFHLLGMVRGLCHLKHGGSDAFDRIWQERVIEAQKRLAVRRAEGLTTKKLIPKVYRDNVGSTPEKTKGRWKMRYDATDRVTSQGPIHFVAPPLHCVACSLARLGFFLCGRHNLATLFDKVAPARWVTELLLRALSDAAEWCQLLTWIPLLFYSLYPDASLE
jgi:hypothetical protein